VIIEAAMTNGCCGPGIIEAMPRIALVPPSGTETKRAAFGQSIALLHHLSSAAVTTLGKMMLEPGTPPATRVRAADSILDHTTKAIEIEDIEARVAQGERAAEASARRW
jgi:hypothetical protein